MADTISRMQFLSGDFRGAEKSFRPPWSVVESHFIKLCNRCGDCLAACPTSILVKGRGGYPVVDFINGECEFCGNCALACKTAALNQSHALGEVPWALKAKVSDTCIAYHGVVCRSCYDQCETRAIEFGPTAGRVPVPQLDIEKCTGCGACVAVCPVNAISVFEPV